MYEDLLFGESTEKAAQGTVAPATPCIQLHPSSRNRIRNEIWDILAEILGEEDPKKPNTIIVGGTLEVRFITRPPI